MASSSDNTAIMIRLKASDNEVFEVEESVVSQMTTIKNMIDDDCAGGVIPLPNVTAPILAKVIEYCKKHAEVDGSVELSEAQKKAALKEWDAEFVNVDPVTLFDIILAGNYLAHKGLLDLTFQAAADFIKNKTPEEIRSSLSIANDFTPEELEELEKESSWTYEE